MKIGLVDLDTSHPENWVPIERELGYEVVCVWDGGDVHPSGYAAKFAAKHGIPTVCTSLAKMAERVDLAILNGCDWDKRIERSRPFVKAGKAILLDKPIAGHPKDLDQIAQWISQGVRITGGSSLRFAAETQAWLAQPVEERGETYTVLCGCATDEFNYGIHAYSHLLGIMGPGVERVRHLGDHGQRRIQLTWSDGRTGFVIVGAVKQPIAFYATIVTDKGVTQQQVDRDSTRLYRALLKQSLPYLAGETDRAPLECDALLEPERCAIAARKSWHEGNREVLLTEEQDETAGYDGKAFAASYRQMKYPEVSVTA